MTSSVIDTIHETIKRNPRGITSPAICAKHPELNRGTVTSAISKLKARGLVKADPQTAVNQAVMLYPSVAPQPQPKAAPVTASKLDVAHIIAVLKPFADLAAVMDTNKVMGKPYVLLSATTCQPTLTIADGDWFFAARDLISKLQS